jgi:AcrR family transcriptional regulator
MEAAEEQFRRVGYHRTSVADIAAELGMSPANIYRFFPSRDAINESICGRVVNEVADIAFAIARTNDVKEVGRRLGVRYVLEGSVRKASGKVRIAGQLIDAITGAHIWADRFERDLTDIFALQDEVTVAVVLAIEPKLLQTEIAMAARRRPENLTAYDFYLRAMQQYYLTSREGLAER